MLHLVKLFATLFKCAFLCYVTSYTYARTKLVIKVYHLLKLVLHITYHAFVFHLNLCAVILDFSMDRILCATTLGFSMERVLCAVTLGLSMERILEYTTVLWYVRHVYFTIMFVHRVKSVREFREYKYTDAQYTEAQYTETGNLLQYTVNNTKYTCFWLIGYTLLTVVQYMLYDSMSRLIPLITGPKDNVSLTCTYGE